MNPLPAGAVKCKLQANEEEFKKMRLKELNATTEVTSDPHFFPKKMILKHGAKNFLLDTSEIVYCYSSNKVVYIVDANNQKYLYDKNLLALEAELDPRMFFKINRTHLINFNFIRSFGAYDKNRLKVELKIFAKDQSVLISQTRAHAFRQWIYQQL